jgi:hypothetical protein
VVEENPEEMRLAIFEGKDQRISNENPYEHKKWLAQH